MNHYTFNRESFYNLVWSKPISVLSKEYRISTSDLRKLCNHYNIPIPPNGHWQKLNHNKKVEIIDLPEVDLNIEIELIERGEGDEDVPFFINPFNKRVYELKTDKTLKLMVPKQLKNEHLLVSKIRRKLEELDKIENSSYELRSKIFEDILPIHTDQKLRNRALRIMNTIVNYLYKHNHSIVFEYGICHVQMYGQRTEINLRQKDYRVRSIDKNGWSRQDWVKSNNLEFQAGPSFRQKSWIDKENKKLESFIPNIVAWIEQDCKYWHDIRKRQAEEKHILEIRRLKEEENNFQLQLAKEKRDNLINESKKWQESQVLRSYILAIAESSKKSKSLDKSKIEWLEWASNIADSIDPLTE